MPRERVTATAAFAGLPYDRQPTTPGTNALPDRAMQEIVKRPHYRATSRIIASTMAAEPNAEDFQQARVILAALLRHGYKVVPCDR